MTKKESAKTALSLSILPFIAAVFIMLYIVAAETAYSDRIQDLEAKISERQESIAGLEAEIAEYEDKLQETKQEARTLSHAIATLDTTRSKLKSDIMLTATRIDNANLNIEVLEIDIENISRAILDSKSALTHSLRAMRATESNTLIEVLFQSTSLSGFLGEVEKLESFQKAIGETLAGLRTQKSSLAAAKQEAEGYRQELGQLNIEFRGKKQVADIARNEKDELLQVTKNQRSNYESLLQEKRRRKELFEQELTAFEAELEEALDPAKIPSARPGTLAWPLKNVVITQYFGNTPFATANPGVYSGRGHNGIDLGASIGTTIHAARDGQVLGTGDTDETCLNASYGKWILVEHDNGLTTLYAHLSLAEARKGDTLRRGDVIGYTGNTGYSTGPHLHFTVFATDAVAIGSLTSKVCSNAAYHIPLLTKSGGYLNPLSYLPEL